jgi:hypothetical protein
MFLNRPTATAGRTLQLLTRPSHLQSLPDFETHCPDRGPVLTGLTWQVAEEEARSQEQDRPKQSTSNVVHCKPAEQQQQTGQTVQ